jgi:hypothetical protein
LPISTSIIEFLRLAFTNDRQEDVLISLVEVPKENWSFGNGDTVLLLSISGEVL